MVTKSFIFFCLNHFRILWDFQFRFSPVFPFRIIDIEIEVEIKVHGSLKLIESNCKKIIDFFFYVAFAFTNETFFLYIYLGFHIWFIFQNLIFYSGKNMFFMGMCRKQNNANIFIALLLFIFSSVMKNVSSVISEKCFA